MLDTSLLGSVAKQMMSAYKVEIEGKRLPVRHTRKCGLKAVSFAVAGREYAAIEQNPDKLSRWRQLARSGHDVVQSKDVRANGSWRWRWTARRRSTAAQGQGVRLAPTPVWTGELTPTRLANKKRIC